MRLLGLALGALGVTVLLAGGVVVNDAAPSTAPYLVTRSIPASYSSRSQDWGGTRSQRWVARFAQDIPTTTATDDFHILPIPLSSSSIPTSHSRSNDFGGTRSQRWVARFADTTPTATATHDFHLVPVEEKADWLHGINQPSPTVRPSDEDLYWVRRGDEALENAVTSPKLPLCCFDQAKGEYRCPCNPVEARVPPPEFFSTRHEMVPVPTMATLSNEFVHAAGEGMKEE